MVLPTCFGRVDDVLYLHGSTGASSLRAGPGNTVCVTVTLVDGLVYARSVFHHSANYRSVMLLGTARCVEDDDEKADALRAVVEHIMPGRWQDVRAPTAAELKATSVLALPIDEASAKIRSGPPLDDEPDYASGAWAGVLPIMSVAGAPQPDPRLRAGIAPPGYASAYRRPGRA